MVVVVVVVVVGDVAGVMAVSSAWYISLMLIDVVLKMLPDGGISTRRLGSVFRQKDITETQMKNTLIEAIT